jgi:hypothetical protein
MKLLSPPNQQTARFGSKEFFKSYIQNQINREGKQHKVIHRVHFAMSQLILETHKGREAFEMLKNLNNACEELSEYNKGVSYLE